MAGWWRQFIERNYGLFHTVCRTEVCSAFVSTVGRALAAEHTVGTLLCLVHHCPTLTVHLTKVVPIHNDSVQGLHVKI